MILEPLAHRHIDEVLEIEKEAHPCPWTGGQFEEELKNPHSHFFIARKAEPGAGIIAYFGFRHLFNEAHIMKVTVKKIYRRRGVGSWLMKKLEEEACGLGCKELKLEFRDNNEAARRLYAGAGFEKKGVRKGYYAGPAPSDAVLMDKLI